MREVHSLGQPTAPDTDAAAPLGSFPMLPPEDVKRFLDGLYELIDAIASPGAEPTPRPGAPRTFTVKVQLNGTKPPIWRRLTVPSFILLSELNEVIVTAMGWSGQHLHQFATLPKKGTQATRFVSAGAFAGPHARFEGDVRLDEVLRAPGDKLAYDYDLATGWRHTVRLEKTTQGSDGDARCLAGRRACPPEDCGGPKAFQQLLEWAKSPMAELTSEQVVRLRHHEPYEGWRPEHFDADAATEALATRAWARTRRARLARALSA